jgi:uncharacterized membrane protein YhfC
MNILRITYFLNGFLMIAIPISFMVILTHKFKQGWRLFWIGAATFVISQSLHIPFNMLVNPVFNKIGFIALPLIMQKITLSVYFGLSAGIFEELSRYAMFRWWAKEARSWAKGLLAGAGHGGIEAIILGIIVLYGYIQMNVILGMDVSKLVSSEKLELTRTQIQAYWSAPWYMTLLGLLERLFTIPLHLVCSLLVLQAFTSNRNSWVVVAIIFHAFVDGIAVFVSQIGFSPLAIEGVIGIFAGLSIGIVFALRKPELRIDPIPTTISTLYFKIDHGKNNRDDLESTRDHN